jgi:hypothetical protein
LFRSSFAEPTLVDSLTSDKVMHQWILASKPASVKQVHLHAFRIESAQVTGTPSINDILDLHAQPELQALSFAQRELIYHESRGHDGCYKAIALYQHFFELCPLGQALSIQIKNETPVLVSHFSRSILEFKMKGPKLLTVSTGMKGTGNPDEKGGTIVTRRDQENLHSALGFAAPGSGHVDFVVDMTRMQWGEAGRGSLGELCYLGSMAGYYRAMGMCVMTLRSSEMMPYKLPPPCIQKLWKLALGVFGNDGRTGIERAGATTVVAQTLLSGACRIAVLAKKRRSVIVAKSIRKRVGNCTSLLVRRRKSNLTRQR